MSQNPAVVATLLIQMAWDEEELKNWSGNEGSNSHPGCLGNTWIMKCYSNEATLANLKALTGIDNVEDVVVVYGDTSWRQYCEENGLELRTSPYFDF